MEVRRNYMVVTYSSLPDVDFICEYGGRLRIKVSQLEWELADKVAEDYVTGVANNTIYRFENIGGYLKDIHELLFAIQWYKRFRRLPNMRVILPARALIHDARR